MDRSRRAVTAHRPFGLHVGQAPGGRARRPSHRWQAASASLLLAALMGSAAPTLAAGASDAAAPARAAGAGNAAGPTRDAVRPTVTMSQSRLEGLGGRDGQFVVDITFSQFVTGFFLSDMTFANAAGSDLTGSGSIYSVVVTPDAEFEGFVSVTIRDGAAANSTGETSVEQTLRFSVDTRPPMYVRSYVNGRTLSMLYDEELDDDQTPPTSSFEVLVEGQAEAPAAVDVDRHEVVLTLRAPVLATDSVSVSYVAGVRRLQDATRNPVAALSLANVVNRTGQDVVRRVPGPPGALTASPSGSSSIRLSWQAPTDDGSSPITGYRVEASSNGGRTWSAVATGASADVTSYTHQGLPPGATRHYRVAAVNEVGAGSYSNVAQATTAGTTPGAPRNLTAAPGGASGRDRIVLNWNAPSSDGGRTITGYRVEARVGGLGWVTLAANTGSAATTYTDSGLSPGTTRTYRVSAINRVGVGTHSNTATASTRTAPPGPPGEVRARAAGSSSIAVSWNPPTDNGGSAVRGYRIEGRQAVGAWTTLVQDTRSTATLWQHSGLAPATTWSYRVSAINAVGVGARSSEASATTEAAVPEAPSGLSARAVSTSQIDLRWSAPDDDGGARITGYRIEASADRGSTWTVLRSNTGSTATTFSHQGLAPNNTRLYRVFARNAKGVGPASNIARATTDPEPPGAPQNPWASSRGPSQIDLSWRAPTYNGGATVTGYRIEASDNGGGSWNTLVANTRTPGTSWSDTGLAPATTRHYRISAINSAGVGAASTVVSTTTDAVVPNAPTGLVATAVAPEQIDLTWTAPGYDGGAQITGYRVEVSETGGAWRDLVANTRSSGTTYSHTGLQPGSVRFYRVSAINIAGAGQPSGVASASTDDPVQRAGRLNASALPRIAATMASSTLSAIAGRVDAVATGRGMSRRMDMGGLSGMAAMGADPATGGFAALGTGGAGTGVDPAHLLGGSSFVLPVTLDGGGAFQVAEGLSLAAWGGGEYSGMSRTGADQLDWNGGLASLHLGADARLATDVIAGVAASRSWGTFDFTDRTGAGAVEGSYGAAMTGVTPYAAWFPGGGGNAVWGAGGFAFGEVEVEDERETARSSPATMMTGAVGGAYQVLRMGIGGLRVKADGWVGRVTVDGTERVDRAVLDLGRGRLAVEWTQGHRTASGLEIGLELEGGARLDMGDGANGVGAEVGGGLRFANMGLGLSAEGRGRLFVSGDGEYEEWGVGGALRLDPSDRATSGLSLRLAPTYGNAASGVNGLWEQGAEAWETVSGRGAARARGMVDGEIAWARRGAGGSPYGAFRLAREGGRMFASGVRYRVGAGMGVGVEVTRREGLPGGAAHAVGVRGRLKF